MARRSGGSTGKPTRASAYLPALHVYVAWHPLKDAGRPATIGDRLADTIYERLCRDVSAPLSRGIGIPVFFRSIAQQGAGAPMPIALDRADRTAVVVLANAEMVVSPTWQSYLRDLDQGVRAARAHAALLPVALDREALNLGVFGSRNFVRYYDMRGNRRCQLVTWLAHELCRFLAPRSAPGSPQVGRAAIRVFLSHAKQDGVSAALELKRKLEMTPAARFYDAVDIVPGHEFDEELLKGIDESTVLVLLTDAYSSRPWCRREVLRAKRSRRPIVVVDMLRDHDQRSFPYVGNVPVVHWSGGNHDEVLRAALLESLRYSYHLERMTALQAANHLPADAVLLARCPEVLDFACAIPPTDGPNPHVIYPDPPVGREEMETLGALGRPASFSTPSMPEQRSLAGRLVAMSISESPEMAQRGLSDMHLTDLLIEVARHLLVHGAAVAYGGDLRRGGMTRILSDLVWAYTEAEAAPVELIRNYLAWPVHRRLSAKARAAVTQTADLRLLPAPPDLAGMGDLDAIAGDLARPEGPYVWARCLTAMRETEIGDAQALIAVGGRVSDYRGRYPGILEEVYVALRAQKPVYLIGQFGGCTQDIVDIIEGGGPGALAADFQRRDRRYAAAMDYYNGCARQQGWPGAEEIDYERVTDFVRSHGPGRLHNGLSAGEDRRLFHSADIDEIVRLLLKGLAAAD